MNTERDIRSESVDEQLRRLCRWCVTGQAAGAELELHDWHRRDDCPAEARVLLGALLAQRGELDMAAQVLRKRGENDHVADDPSMTSLLISVLTALDMPEAARKAVNRLYHTYGHEDAVRDWLVRMQSPGVNELPPHAHVVVERLANELADQPQVIPSLVVAQKLEPDDRTIQLLRLAIVTISRTVTDHDLSLTLCQAMAELALLEHDTADARRWAHRGLEINPYHAPLALVLARIDDDTSVGRPAVEVLADVSQAHPTYPDVRAAWIRRQSHDGQRKAARMNLRDWLKREPQNPIAKKLKKELAA